MDKVILFITLTLPLLLITGPSLVDPKSRGFSRFFSWECMIALIVISYQKWFVNPFSATQIVSWLLLIISIYLVYAGGSLLMKARKPGVVRVDEKLFRFEKTTELVTTGIFRYIRHPLYSSLLFLTWGIWFKQPMLITFPIAVLASALLLLTAIREEHECLTYFGEKYREYMNDTKRLIPFVF